jgi:hypothetical protein
LTLRILIFLVLLLQIACGQIPKKPIASKPFAFVDSLLAKESYTAEFLDFEYPKDILDISLRFQKAFMENKEWFEEYSRKYYKAGIGMPYHENFGITKEEYERIKDMQKTPPSVKVRSTALLRANRGANTYSFKVSEKGIKFIESLKIDFGKGVLLFMNDTLPFKSEINATATPLGEWHGYSWQKTTPAMRDDEKINIDSLTVTTIEVDFGKSKKDNKIILRLKYQSIDNGAPKANLDLICYLK